MLDIKDIRKNLNFFKKKLEKRNSHVDLDKIIEIDKKNREIIQKKEKLENEKKLITKEKKQENFQKSKELSVEINELSKENIDLKKELDKLLSNLPNIPLEDVPIGKDETFNKIIRKEGKINKFEFKLRSHVDIGEKNKELDFETSSKLSGSRFAIIKGKLALLERALINFMLDTHTKKFSYKEISPPLIVNEDVMYGTGQLPKFEVDQYEVKLEKSNEKKFLIPTAEVVLTNFVKKSVIDEKELPLRLVASTPCFRKEAGSYGKDTKGLMRQHQFYKVELVSIVKPSDTNKELSRMLNCAEEILKLLELPYQIVLLSSGDMGFSAEKTFDIEVWIPSENKYREISSCSSCGSFQARRMNAKYKTNNGSDFVATLNGSGLAVGRLMIAIMENYQKSDGSFTLPKALKKYM